MRGTLMRVIAGAIAGGAAVGVVLGLTVFAPADPVPASLSGVAVPVYACPGADEVGTLHRGDRVLVTGRSGDWLAVRNVRGAFERVFVAAASVVPDADLSGLPEVGCDDTATIVVAVTSTTVPAEDTTTTTTTPVDGSTTTTTVTATTTTVPDQTPPTIGSPSVSPDEIWELDGMGITCPPGTARQATIAATVTDAGGVQSVVALWTDPSGNRQQAMSGAGGTYSFTFGPYPAGTWDAAMLAPFDHLVTVTIRARDSADNESTRVAQVTVWETGQCFG